MASQTNLKLKQTERPTNQDTQPAGPPEVDPTVIHTAVQGAEVTVGPGHIIDIIAGRHPAASQTLKPLIGNRATRRAQ